MSRRFPLIVRRCLGAVLLAGSLGVAAAQAQPPGELSLWNGHSRPRWLQFRVASGRIQPVWLRRSDSSHTGRTNDTIKEQFVTRSNPQEAHYDYTSPELNITFDVAESRLAFRVVPRGKPKREELEFIQSMAEPVVLKIGPAGQARAVEAASLWHLLILEPEAGKQLVAWLQVLRIPSATVDLAKMLEEAQAVLVHKATSVKSLDRQRLDVLVTQLGASQFALREAADRELRAMGAVLLPYWERIDLARLDVEQQYRVRRILASLANTQSNDTAEWIAMRFQEDALVWLALLSRSDESVRRVAASRLQAILNRPIAVDPAADEAVRKRQIDALQAELHEPPAKEK